MISVVLTNLRVPNSSKNQLAALPKSIGELTAMEELYGSESVDCEVPDEIGNLEKLEIVPNNQKSGPCAAIDNWSLEKPATPRGGIQSTD